MIDGMNCKNICQLEAKTIGEIRGQIKAQMIGTMRCDMRDMEGKMRIRTIAAMGINMGGQLSGKCELNER